MPQDTTGWFDQAASDELDDTWQARHNASITPPSAPGITPWAYSRRAEQGVPELAAGLRLRPRPFRRPRATGTASMPWVSRIPISSRNGWSAMAGRRTGTPVERRQASASATRPASPRAYRRRPLHARFRIILPVASVDYGKLSVEGAYVPGGKGFGNVDAVLWLKWRTDSKSLFGWNSHENSRRRFRRPRACAGLAPGAGTGPAEGLCGARAMPARRAKPELENLPLTDIDALADLRRRRKTSTLTVVGPEAPLAAGIVDVFRARGLRIFGPTQAAAQLESSKDFAKRFMARHGIPTAKFADLRRRRRRRTPTSMPRARRSSSRPTAWPPARAWSSR